MAASSVHTTLHRADLGTAKVGCGEGKKVPVNTRSAAIGVAAAHMGTFLPRIHPTLGEAEKRDFKA